MIQAIKRGGGDTIALINVNYAISDATVGMRKLTVNNVDRAIVDFVVHIYIYIIL